jgi:hypothetical protein
MPLQETQTDIDSSDLEDLYPSSNKLEPQQLLCIQVDLLLMSLELETFLLELCLQLYRALHENLLFVLLLLTHDTSLNCRRIIISQYHKLLDITAKLPMRGSEQPADDVNFIIEIN